MVIAKVEQSSSVEPNAIQKQLTDDDRSGQQPSKKGRIRKHPPAKMGVKGIDLPGDRESWDWSNDPAFARFVGAVNVFKASAEASGVVSGLLVGSKPDVKMGFVWTIYDRNYDISETIEGFDRLELAIYAFKKDLRDVLPLRIAGVQPARVVELVESCESQGLEVELVRFSR